jgi:hypothetical protein
VIFEFGTQQELQLLALLVSAAALLILAGPLRIPYPILLVLGGLALGFVPGVPTVQLPPDLTAESDNLNFPARSPWRLVENDLLLGPPHSIHADIVNFGKGRYSHWNGYFYFSTSDNSNPTLNGREYKVSRSMFLGCDRSSQPKYPRSD